MIDPDSLRSIVVESDAREIGRAEELIDKDLIKTAGNACVDLSGLGLRKFSIEALVGKYRFGGYEVEIQPGDQRDPGPFIRVRLP